MFWSFVLSLHLTLFLWYTMNIYQVSDDVFRFRIWNVVSPSEVGLDGHYTIWWRTDGKWLLGHHGGYGSLTYYPAGNDDPKPPTDLQRAFLKPIIDKEIQYARFWKHFRSGGTINNEGAWLHPDTQKRALAGEYISMSTRTVFDVDYVMETHGMSDNDRKAIGMLKASSGEDHGIR